MRLIAGPKRIANRWAILTILAVFPACSDDKVSCASPGAAAGGAADAHCGTMVQTVDPNACMAQAGGGNQNGGNYGDTMYNYEGDDDDCKYHVKWSATTLCQNANVNFTV